MSYRGEVVLQNQAALTTLQVAYANGAAGGGIVSLSSTGGGLKIRDNVAALGTTLFGVQDSTGTSKYVDVLATTTTFSPGAGGTVVIGGLTGTDGQLSAGTIQAKRVGQQVTIVCIDGNNQTQDVRLISSQAGGGGALQYASAGTNTYDTGITRTGAATVRVDNAGAALGTLQAATITGGAGALTITTALSATWSSAQDLTLDAAAANTVFVGLAAGNTQIGATANGGSATLKYNQSAATATSAGGLTLPANLRGYLVISVGGATKKVPYYDN